MIEGIEEGPDVQLDHPVMPGLDLPPHLVNGLVGRSLRPEPIRGRLERRLEDGLHHQPRRGLENTVADPRNPERTLACAVRLGDVHPPHR
jgi:hypothetical protein